MEEALPKLIDEVQDRELKTGLKEHLSQTRQHVSNVEQVFELLGETPHEEESIAFEGLKKEHEEMVKVSSRLIDLVDLGAAARTEKYEMAAYEGLRRMAKALGEEKAVELLDENLSQEKETLREVERIATRSATSRSRQQRHNVRKARVPRSQPGAARRRLASTRRGPRTPAVGLRRSSVPAGALSVLESLLSGGARTWRVQFHLDERGQRKGPMSPHLASRRSPVLSRYAP